MGNATDKQIYFLKSKNIDASNMDFDTASKLIGSFKAPTGVATKPESPSFEKAMDRKPFDTSSYYVSYAKDICVALIEKFDMKDPLNVEKLMQLSIKAVLDAREAFK